jgi:hypothetical protein
MIQKLFSTLKSRAVSTPALTQEAFLVRADADRAMQQTVCQSAHKNDPDRLANLTPSARRLDEADTGVRTARVCARPGWPVGRKR